MKAQYFEVILTKHDGVLVMKLKHVPVVHLDF